MFRFLSLATIAALGFGAGSLLAQDPSKAVDVKFSGQIVESDAKDTVRQYPCKTHVVKLEKGRTYLIDMICNDMSLDPYLRIEDSVGNQLAEDDDGGGNLNARIRFTPPKDDAFKIIATTFAGGEGNYVLTVKEVDAGKQAVQQPKKGEVPSTPKKDVEKKDVAKKSETKEIPLDTLTDKRYWVEVEGRLQKGDPIDPVQNQICKTYSVEMKKGVKYVIDMRSPTIDSFLRLVDPKGNEVAKDDDSGVGVMGLDAQIRIEAPTAGIYRIVATTFEGGLGEYMLKVALEDGGKKVKEDKAAAKKPDTKKDDVKGDAKKDAAKAEPVDKFKLETPTDKKPVDVGGKLQDGDPLDDARNQLSKKYSIDLDEGVIYTIDLISNDFDSFLRVLDSKGKELAFDDDGGGDLHARITFAAPAKGKYHIVATSFDGGAGDFRLKVQQTAKSNKYDADKVHTVAAAPIYITGRLTNKDAKDDVQQNSPCQVTQVKLAKGKTYVIDLISGQMDSFLRVEDAKKKQLADDDDSGGGLNSRLSFTPDEDGTFRLIATNLDGMEGNYILVIREEK